MQLKIPLTVVLIALVSVLGHNGDWNGERFKTAPKHVRHIHETRTNRDYDLTYYDLGGVNITMGDIVLDPDYIDFLEGHGPDEVPQVPHLLGVTHSDNGRRWPCPIPFLIDSSLPDKNRVTDAIAHIESNTQWRFVTRTYEDRYLVIRDISGCWSSVGKNYGTGAQEISLSNGCNYDAAIHEILHAIGSWHEQSREDRDTHVTIQYDNIQAGTEHNFVRYVTSGRDIGPYDFDSIMHYDQYAFSSNGQPTITINNGLPSDSCGIGSRDSMSMTDTRAAMDRWYPTTQCPIRTKQLVAGMTVRFESSNYPGYFIRHQNNAVSRAQSDGSATFNNDTLWIVENGLAGRGLSFRAASAPDRYLRHSGWTLKIDPSSTDNTYRHDASFNLNDALFASGGNQVSLSSVGNQHRFVRHRGGGMYVEPLGTATELFRQDATWNLEVATGVTFTQSHSFGGTGGTAFSDSGSSGSEITAINVRADGRIHQIQVEHGGSAAAAHGGSGGSANRFALNSGESIKSVCVFSEGEVEAIQFHTSTGRSSPKYGGCDGDLHCVYFGDERLRYISGRAGARMDQITFHY